MNSEAGSSLSRSSLPPMWGVEQHPFLAPEATLQEIERAAILRGLKSTNWNKQAAAAVLGLRRPTLYSRMRKHGIPLRREEWWTINSEAGLGVQPQVDEAALKKEREMAKRLREWLLNELALTNPLLGELKLASALWDALEEIGRFCRVSEKTAYFIRQSDDKMYEINGKLNSAFVRLVICLAGISASHPAMRRSLEYIQSRTIEEAPALGQDEAVSRLQAEKYR